MKTVSCWQISKNSYNKIITWCQHLLTNLWLSYSEWVDSIIAVLKKQILKQNVWFECYYYK